MDSAVAATLFAVTYLLIAVERFPRTAVALLGAMLMILLNGVGDIDLLNQEEAFAAIDFNVIFLLVGMMVIANTVGRTGAFQWLAIRSAKMGRGNPIVILLLLSVVTAVLSALLDNVTTVVLIAPVTFFVASSLQVNPVPFLISEVLASNIGGTATLIGDPPNILIGSHADLGFLSFLLNLAPASVVILATYLVLALIFWRSDLRAAPEVRSRIMEIDESEVITDPALLRTSSAVLALVILGFLLHEALDYQPATVALLGASALIVLGRQEAHDVLRDVEWATIFFFVGLFIVVGGVERVGLLEDIGEAAADLTKGNQGAAATLVLWLSGLLSGIVDNIPYTAAMVPVVDELVASTGRDDDVLWWSLALGAGLGGNLTVIAAAANVLVANLALRAGHRISFFQFLRYGALATGVSLGLATAYIWLRYLWF